MSSKSIIAADAALAQLKEVPPSEIEEVIARIRACHSSTYQAAQAAKAGAKSAAFDEGDPTIGGLGHVGRGADPNRF